MNADFRLPASESLPYRPLPPEHRQFIYTGLIQSRFAPVAIRDEHEFTAKNKAGRLKVNCVAFTDDFHHDLDTSAVAVYYEPEYSVSDEVILKHMIFSGAPFVFIGRESKVLPYGIRLNGKPEPQQLGSPLAYNEIGGFLDKYKVDINPSRISAVKSGIAQFVAFPQLNSFQLRLFTLDITRELLAENFGSAVNSLRETIGVGKSSQSREKIVTEIAVQLLGSIVLAHKGRLSSECLEQNASFDTVFKCAAASFSNYFDLKLVERHSRAAEAAYRLLSQATYSSFTPDMLTELYLRAYPDAEKRKLGRFDTPLYLTRRIVDNLPIETIRPEKRLLADITCGWGSFLVAGYERLSRLADMTEGQRPLWEHVIGNDIDTFTTQLAKLALLTTSLSDSWIVDNQDALDLKWPDHHPTIIVGNPKFRGDRKLGQESTEIDRLTGESKRLQEADKFLQQAIRLLEPGGYLGMLMPKSFSIAESSTETRKALLESCDILEIWDLPDELFESQAKVRPMVIFAQKRKEAGYLVDYPVRIRVAQGQTFAHIGVFDAASLAPSQSKWGSESKKARRSEAKVTHLITYTTILPEAKWKEIFRHCRKLAEVADITPGATVGTKRPWANFPQPKQVPWLYGAKQSMPYPFLIRYSSDTILYPNELERPRKNSRYPHKDSEHLLASPKVLLASDPDPSWGKRAKVAIERHGYYVSDSFWVFVPKPGTFSLEVLAAVLSWDVSNAWIVESLRYPKIQRRILNTIPVPTLSTADCERIEKAVREIEAAVLREGSAPKAQQVLDDVLKKAYGLDDKPFRILRRIMEWDSRPESKRPVPPDSKTVFRVSGQVETANASTQKITLWFDGIPGTHTVPLVESMPGWMLREGAAFSAEVSYQALRSENWRRLEWWNIRPKEYTYLTENELLEQLAVELASA